MIYDFHSAIIFFFQAEDGIRDGTVTGVQRVLFRSETFGPVVIVEPVADAEAAIMAANRSMYGLTSSIVAGDTYRAFELAARVQAGAVHINLPTINDEIQAPVGGVRDSGWGRSGPHALDDFTDLIWVDVQAGRRSLPF